MAKGTLDGITYRMAGQGRLAGGELGQGGERESTVATAVEAQVAEAGRRSDGKTGGTQTTLDSYWWADSMPSSQTTEEGVGSQAAGAWGGHEFSEFVTLLEAMAEKA